VNHRSEGFCRGLSEAKRLRALEDENARLKRLYADAMLDNAGLKELVAKKW
jgi:putative transposase